MEVRRRNHPLYNKHAAASSSGGSGSDKQRVQEEVGEVSDVAAVQQIDPQKVSGAGAVDEQGAGGSDEGREYRTALEEFKEIFEGRPLNLFNELEVNQEEEKTGAVALPLGEDEVNSKEEERAKAEGLKDPSGRPLDEGELKELRALQSSDQALRAEASEGAQYELRKGPDGKQYAVARLSEPAESVGAEAPRRRVLRAEGSAKPWKEKSDALSGRKLPY